MEQMIQKRYIPVVYCIIWARWCTGIAGKAGAVQYRTRYTCESSYYLGNKAKILFYLNLHVAAVMKYHMKKRTL